ncbi:MAG TPA: MarR family transcriptional regulator [Mucilaginibacter sp.]|jgi:DNA-binding MarR family transcriptional regulator
MSDQSNTLKEVYDLMLQIRKFTRSSLMLQYAIAQEAGLQASEAECIDFLTDMGPSTAGALAKATGLTTGAITNLVDRLERAGFVKRSADPRDRRKVIVSVIAEKKEDIGAHYAGLAASVQELLSSYSQEELQFLIRYMSSLTNVYETVKHPDASPKQLPK